MPNPVYIPSEGSAYRSVAAFYQAARKHPSRARLYHQYTQRLGGNSFEVLFHAHIDEVLSRSDVPTVFVVNMSGFGAVNESYGHDAGDQFLDQTQAHIYQFFQTQGIEVAISRSGINFVIVAKGLRNGAAKKTLGDLQAYLASPERTYPIRVATKYITRDGGVRAEIQKRPFAQPSAGLHAVDLRTAPIFNSRQRTRVGFPSFYVGLIEGQAGVSAVSYKEAVEKAIVSINIRSGDKTQPPVHTYSVTALSEPVHAIPLFVTRREIDAFQGLLATAREADGIWQGTWRGNAYIEQLLSMLNVDSRTGLPTGNAFLTKLEEIYATRTPHTVVSVDINAFGSFNATFNSDGPNGEISVLGKLLGDHAVLVLGNLLEEVFIEAGLEATVSRHGGDELRIISPVTPHLLGIALKQGLAAKLEAAAKDPDLEFKIPEEKVIPAMRLKLAAQGIVPKNGIYSINVFTIERRSPKYAGKTFTGLSVSLGVVRISNFERPSHEHLKDADGMAECAKKQTGVVRIYYDRRDLKREDEHAVAEGPHRRYVNGG